MCLMLSCSTWSRSTSWDIMRSNERNSVFTSVVGLSPTEPYRKEGKFTPLGNGCGEKPVTQNSDTQLQQHEQMLTQDKT